MSLSAKVQKLLEARARQGGYGAADDVVIAALAALENQSKAGEFKPGELQTLLDEGDADIERGNVIDGRQALEERRRGRRAGQGKKAG